MGDTFGEVLAAAKPVTKSVRICMRGDLIAEIERLDADWAQAREDDERLNRLAEAPDLAARITDLTEEAKAAEVEFVFQSMGRRAWRDLLAMHGPSDEDKKAGFDYNRQTFPVAAMAASCIAPKGATVEGFEEFADSPNVTDAHWNRLWLTCYNANTGGAEVPQSRAAFAPAGRTETSSESRGTTGSPAPSS